MNWIYSDKVKEHFFNPKNFLANEPKKGEFDGKGEIGSVVCGDIMKIWIKIDKNTKKITDLKWQTWGCATAIASTSMFSEMILEINGMTIKQAMKIAPKDIIKRLKGLPLRKVHCSVLADQAFKKAVKDYENKVK